MPTPYDANLFNKSPYYDDFDESKKFLRTLFRPGYAVQARELTQLQTVLQSQLERIGSHIFENGAVIAGGGIAESNIAYARLGTADALSTTNLNRLVDQNISNDTGVNARIIHVLGGSTLDIDPSQVVFFQYTSNGSFSEGSTLGTTGANSAGLTFSIAAAGNTAPSVGSDAMVFSVNEGIYYVDGYFVKNDKQVTVPFYEAGSCADGYDHRYRGFVNPTSSVGWNISRTIVTANDDNSLKDPASGFYNQNAPGADRYKVDLSLGHKGFTSALGSASGLTFDNQDFIELVRVVGGSSTKTVKYTDYAEIEETFARRTFDESGNYTVGAPKIRITTHDAAFTPADSAKFAVGVEPNKSYVGGFEVDTQSTAYLEVDKARDLGKVPPYLEQLNTQLGNYIFIEEDETEGSIGGGWGSGTSADNSFSANSIDKQYSYSLYKENVHTEEIGPTLGSCNVRSIAREGNDTKLYLFNIKMADGNDGAPYNFTDVKYLVSHDPTQGGTGGTGSYFKVKADSDGFVGPHDAGRKSLVFPVSKNRVISDTGPGKSVETASLFTVLETHDVHFTNGTSSAITTLGDGKRFLDSDDENVLVWFGATASDGDLDAGYTADLLPLSEFRWTSYGSRGQLELLNGLDAPSAGATATMVIPVVYDSQEVVGDIYRTLTSTSASLVGAVSNSVVFHEGITCAKFPLDNSHIKSLDSVSDGSGVKPESSTYLDDGQRQSAFYKGNVFVPTNILSGNNTDGYVANINYTYYSHTGKGPVTVNSYPLDYESIPEFIDKESGKIYRLRDCIDFRPVENSDGSFTNFGIPFFKYNQAFNRISYDYYMPRIDKVCLCKDRTYRLIKGVSSTEPQAPETTSGDMDLYLIKISPYVFDLNKDVTAKYIDNKRYTMRQISEIENQVEKVDQERYLDRLYSDTVAKGNADAGTGVNESIMVDDFSSHSFSDVSNRDHNCSMDTSYRGLLPPKITSAYNFTSSSIPSGMTLTDGRQIIYDFQETEVVSGSTGTATLAVNPFGNTDFLGYMKLNPSSDIWYDTEKNGQVIVNSFGENNLYKVTGKSWTEGRTAGWGGEDNEWINRWLGTEDLSEKIQDDVDHTDREYRLPNKIARVKLPDRILRTAGDRTVDESVSPYARSKGFTFEATGLLPGSTVYALLDNTLVGASGTGYSVSSQGGVSGHITVTNSFLSGPISFRLSDSSTNTLSSTNTAADCKFYSQGLLDSSNSTIVSARTPQSRRKSVASESVINGPFLNVVDGNFSSVQNGLDPLAQEISVDAGTFPQGVFLRSIDLFFKQVDSNIPVNVHIRPVINGAPHDFLVVPDSEVTVKPTVVGDGPQFSQKTNFKFNNPVFLPPGNWAICLSSNSADNILFVAETGEIWLNSNGTQNNDSYVISDVDGNGIKLKGLLKPLNNGSRTKDFNQNLMININRCQFTGGASEEPDRTAAFNLSIPSGSTGSGLIANVISNKQLFTDSSIRPTYNLTVGSETYNGIVPNKDILLNQRHQISSGSEQQLRVVFGSTTTNYVSPVIDMDRLGLLVADSALRVASSPSDTGLRIGETQNNSSAANSYARYISKKVTFGNTVADDIRVFLDIAPNEGNVKVFAKLGTSGEDFDDLNYVQLYKDGDSSAESEWFDSNSQVLKSYTFKPATSIGEFSSYAIKIVISKNQPTITEDRLPIIKDLRAIAVKN